MRKIKRRLGGIKTKYIVIPIVVVLAILHTIVISMILLININSNLISSIMRSYGEYMSDATSLLAGSSLLSETSTTYVLMPTNEIGEINYGVIIGYTDELGKDRRGDDVAGRFSEYDVGDEAKALINAAAASANEMMDAQLHAIALVNTVYPLPNIPPLQALPGYELTSEELALSKEEKMDLALNLVFGSEYSSAKRSVSDNVSECNEVLRAEQIEKSAVVSKNISITRAVLWIVTISVAVILVLMFILFYNLLFTPLRRFVNSISKDEKLKEDDGVFEVRLLASAYNDLLERREHFEDALRLAAETDALTNLPNRFCFNGVVASEKKSGYSVAIILFDINYLKETNDSFGHLAGDKLIKKAADCISDSFGKEQDSQCFRFGGDEFVAMIKNCTEKRVVELLADFKEVQQKTGISIASGYAFADDIANTTLTDLLVAADIKMYENKSKMHDEISKK